MEECLVAHVCLEANWTTNFSLCFILERKHSQEQIFYLTFRLQYLSPVSSNGTIEIAQTVFVTQETCISPSLSIVECEHALSVFVINIDQGLGSVRRNFIAKMRSGGRAVPLNL